MPYSRKHYLSWPWLSAVCGCTYAPAIVLLIGAGQSLVAGEVSFDRDVRPILSDNCFHCHGPDPETRQAGLRLDTREGIVESVVVPSLPAESELLLRIESDDESLRMPPPDTGLTLSEAQRATLRQWIEKGAEFAAHWSFEPLPTAVAIPAVENDQWSRSPIDRFVLAKLKDHSLAPSVQAPPWKLHRRLCLCLTGLPPSLEEVDRFEQEALQDLDAALEAAVDRLLASPAYGEHLATAWLDAARYADSHGYQSDQLNTQWPYRDWVVNAFNENLPYDQFLTEQLAGDLLKNPTRDQVLATAFNRLHRMTNEGGSIPEEWLVENAADRVHTFGTAILGLTLECARCHDHKYDPITQRDYYSLFAFFNSIDENGLYDHTEKVPAPSILLPNDDQKRRLAKAQSTIAAARRLLRTVRRDGNERFMKWRAAGGRIDLTRDLVKHVSFDEPVKPGGDPAGTVAYSEAGNVNPEHPAPAIARVPGKRGQAAKFDGDRRLAIVSKEELTIDREIPFTLDFWLDPGAEALAQSVVVQQTYGTDAGYNGFDLVIADGRLEARLYRVWPGNGIGVRSTSQLQADQWRRVTVVYDGSSRAAGLRLYLDGVAGHIETLRDRSHKRASFHRFGDGYLALAGRFRDRGLRDSALDEVRVYRRALTPLEIELLGDSNASDERMLASEADERRLREYYLSAIDEECRDAVRNLQEAREALIDLEETIQEVAVMQELPEPRPAHILARGAYDAPRTDANRVQRDVFEGMLPPFPTDAPRNRLGLAQWAVSDDHPLTARVFVNRIWANFFGRGLVDTPENFGSQGSRPSHPELLDWLARDFVDHGWNVKRLCKQIALSATFQQESRHRTELANIDPANTLLARWPSRRLSAEQIRDLALIASGLLTRECGGPPVSPYQPGGDLWREANQMSPPYQQSTGRSLYRRSIYSVWKRTAPLPNMLVFDAPTREVCTVSRSRTSTPLQALVLLNDVQFVEAARALACRVSKRHDEQVDQLAEAFVLLASRRPTEQEINVLFELHDQQQAEFQNEAGLQAAQALLRIGESTPPVDVDVRRLAALTVVCQAILNSDAAIYLR